jgi:hypothetical protein
VVKQTLLKSFGTLKFSVLSVRATHKTGLSRNIKMFCSGPLLTRVGKCRKPAAAALCWVKGPLIIEGKSNLHYYRIVANK